MGIDLGVDNPQTLNPKLSTQNPALCTSLDPVRERRKHQMLEPPAARCGTFPRTKAILSKLELGRHPNLSPPPPTPALSRKP